MFPLDTFYYFEIQALLTALLFMLFSRDRVLRWFPLYLLFILSIELTARYIRKVNHQPNVWLYDISIPVEYLFYSLVFYGRMHSGQMKKITGWFIALFGLFVIINIIFIQGPGVYNTHSVLLGSVAMILLSGYTLFELYKQDHTHNVWTLPYFWIATGVLIFNAGEFAYNLFSNYLVNTGFDKEAKFFASINNTILIPVLYFCLTIGFVCSKVTETYRRE